MKALLANKVSDIERSIGDKAEGCAINEIVGCGGDGMVNRAAIVVVVVVVVMMATAATML